jgi:hypothetical protein
MSQAKHKGKHQIPPDEKLWRRLSVKFGNNEELWDNVWDSDTNVIEQYWSTIIITLPEEPARVQAHSQYLTFY